MTSRATVSTETSGCCNTDFYLLSSAFRESGGGGGIKPHSSVRPSVRHKTLTWLISSEVLMIGALIFGMHDPCDKPFQFDTMQ